MSIQTSHQRFAPAGAAREVEQLEAGPQGESGVYAGARIVLHLVLAGIPLVAISAQVFGLLSLRTAAALIVVPLVVLVALLSLFASHASDRIILPGLLWGMAACVVYDVFRLDTVYMLGLWGDFIPTMGSWVTGGQPGSWDGAVVGYVWRYVGDGGGIGIAFFIVAVALGLGQRSRRDAVVAGVAFAVFPVWTGLIATVALAPRGQEMMFPLTATTVTLSLVGHLIFGIVLGLGFWQARGVQRFWPWQHIRLRSRSSLTNARGRDRMHDVGGVSRTTYEEWQRELECRRPSRRHSAH